MLQTTIHRDIIVFMKKIPTRFKPYYPDQILLLPPDMRQWLPEGDLAFFIMDVVGELDLSGIYNTYSRSRAGQPPYDPRMMASLILYAYCMGIPSSRKIETATYRQIPFRVLTADQHPDHDTIADFRKTHLKALAGLFVDVLRLCQKAGLASLGHIALDGTKVKANASKHKAMSYGRMEKTVQQLEAEVKHLLEEAQTVDENEDARYGNGKRIDEIPEELQRRQKRLAKIKEAKKALEDQAKADAEVQRQALREKENALEKEGKSRKGRKPKDPSDQPDPKAQRNFTDSDSRIMKDGASKSFEQAYNCQVAANENQIIVGRNVTQQTNDKQQLTPLVEDVKEMNGEKPGKVSSDSGYYSDKNVAYLESEEIDGYVAPGRHKHSENVSPAPRGRIPKNATPKERMARKVRTKKGRATYSKRKHIVEPVFGQIKEARGFRRFSLRGLENVTCEWDIVCLTHNILKLFRSGFLVQVA
jgi:transposase